jgi:hypothetical protein
MQILEMPRLKNAFDQLSEAPIAGQTEARDSPARDVSHAQLAAGFRQPLEGRTAGVSRTQNAAHAGTRDMGNWYVIRFQDLQHADMREASCKAPA